LESDVIGNCEKKVYMNIYRILSGYRDRPVRMYRYENIVYRN